MKLLRFVILIIIFCCGASFSQSLQSEKSVQEIIDFYNAFDYRRAEQKGVAALENYSDFSIDQLVLIHEYLAFINYTEKNYDGAKNHFLSALTLNPNLTLSPRAASPKIINFFNDVKRQKKSQQPMTGFVNYVFVPDRRLAAGFRSALTPGWGQIFKGEKKKGAILASLWVANLSGLVYFHFQQKNAHTNYLKEKDLSRIEQKYKTYNKYYKTRNGLILSAAAIWIYSYLDALILKEKIPISKTTSLDIRSHFSQNSIFEVSFSISW